MKTETAKKLTTILLTIALCVTTLSVLDHGYFSYITPIFIIGCTLMFFMCEFVNAHELIGTFIVIFYLALVGILMLFLMFTGFRESGVVFLEWMLTRADEVTSDVRYTLCLSLGSITFFGFTVYYFTRVRYRMIFLTLVTIMPCILYAKVVAQVDDAYLCIIAFLCMLAGVFHIRDGVNEKYPFPVMPMAVYFTLFILLLCALIPRKEEAKYYDRFEDLFLLNGNRDIVAEADLSALNEFSGDADGYQSTNPRRLFMLIGDEPPYLKRQNFDYYDFETDKWYKDERYTYMTSSQSFGSAQEDEAKCTRLIEALNTVEKVQPGFMKKYGLEAALDPKVSDKVNDDLHSLAIVPIRFNPEYFLGSSRQVGLLVSSTSDKKYNIYYLSDGANTHGMTEGNLTNISAANAERMLEEAIDILSESSVLYKMNNSEDYELSQIKSDVSVGEMIFSQRCLSYFYDRMLEANNYRNAIDESGNTDMVSDEIRNLALEITKDCEYDYQKASALATYFHLGEFTYDLDYRPVDDSPEYFLFNSKTGSCSDFASAYVLMARSVGLNVRYAEGFKYENSTRERVYYVRETDSHAYPEVYIPLVGWCVYEPTISAEEKLGFFEKLGLDIKIDFGLITYVTGLILIVSIVGVFVKLILPFLLDICFAIYILFVPKHERPLKRYRRMIKKAAKKRGKHILAMTPSEYVADYGQRYPKRKHRVRKIQKLVQDVEHTVYENGKENDASERF